MSNAIPLAAAAASAATSSRASRSSVKAASAPAAAAAAAAAAVDTEEAIRSHHFVVGLRRPCRRPLSRKAEPKEAPEPYDRVAAARKAARLRLPSLVKRAHRHERAALLKRQRIDASVHLESYKPGELGGEYPGSDECSEDSDALSLPDSNETPGPAENAEHAARLRLPRVLKRSHRIERSRLDKRQKVEFSTLLQSYTSEELDGKYSDEEWHAESEDVEFSDSDDE